jgi:hypothetical protein
MMTEQLNPVVISSGKTDGLSETSTEQRGKGDALNHIDSWAWNAIGILVESTPNELRYSGASKIIEDFRVLPIQESLGKETISKIMDAQAKLLLFELNLIEDFRVLPIQESLGKETISKIMDAQAKLLLFELNLTSCLKDQIDERELEHSRQSCLEALSDVIQLTSF